jgi:hypothetical protein
MRSVADALRDDTRRRVEAMSPDERMRAALSLGDDDVRRLGLARRINPGEARAIIRRQRRAGRRSRMTTESPLVVRVTAIFEQAHVPYALIGAVALSLYGISRSTLDIDLLVTDRRVLEPDFWSDLDATGVRVDARRGDADDPLSGVVRRLWRTVRRRGNG